MFERMLCVCVCGGGRVRYLVPAYWYEGKRTDNEGCAPNTHARNSSLIRDVYVNTKDDVGRSDTIKAAV